MSTASGDWLGREIASYRITAELGERGTPSRLTGGEATKPAPLRSRDDRELRSP